MYKLLEQINSPNDLKKMKSYQIKLLAEEIRNFLVESVSKTGGHLASNLGVVELTLALHTVYDSLQDKIIWDVGHQSYVHKILTDRRKQFSTLRQYKGISGFPKRYESSHDHFDTGHSSTSISAALGMACSRDLNKEKHSVIAVIGDGALTGGMAFEALNHAGQSKKNIIVILNDNAMSISHNVGGLSNYLNKIRTNAVYSKVKDDFESLINNIPAIGKSVFKTAEKAKDCIKYFFVPGILFEELGFKYIGPIDGHDYSQLCNVLKNCKNIKGPILLHVMTKKGKGYQPAEKYPDKFHGVSPFMIETGKPASSSNKISYSEVVGNTLVECGEKNNRVVAITAAMPAGTGLSGFQKRFPERFFDVGIAEQHAITFAAGLAATGYKPFFAVYSTFLQRGYDQIIHDICLQNLPVTLLIDRAGLVGNDGETHHGAFDLSFLLPIPNLTIMAPKDGSELKKMIQYSISENKPIAIRYPRGSAINLQSPSENNDIITGKGEILYHEGNDVLLIAVGHMNAMVLGLCNKLKENSIDATLINPRFIKPLDEDLIIKNATKAKKIYVIEDNAKIGGVGLQIQGLLNKYSIYKEVHTIGLPDEFIQHGDTSTLYDLYGLTEEEIFKRICEAFQKKAIKNIVITR
ncbi:1-deoxy-D-xylulose-5-phosphate synthase [Natronincola peptidivorans]|nr:1-deoxy-D-xylulose-5-phosphate synthase [Natronincola peptidivorans]